MRKLSAFLISLIILGAPLAARAQDAPSYSTGQYNGDEQIRGRIASFDGAYSLQVRDEHGYIDNVRLHQGTIINPTGLTLAPGMTVSILGYNSGSYFAANEVDTPYTFVGGGVPYYAGHPWNYYGPSVSLGFFFGNPGWWHGGYFYGPYHFYNGVRVYNNVRVNNFYHGGSWNGHNYVAPQAQGGYYHGGYNGGYNGGGYHGGNGGGHGGPH